MKSDEFAFFNQQLSVMLREGIPLEAALKQLSTGMRSGPLRTEVQGLEADLAKGIPLKEAVEKRNLPELYRRMVQVGAASNDLSGVLTLVADHYQAVNTIWTRLKGLLVYPALVLITALAVSLLLSVTVSRFLAEMKSSIEVNPQFSFAFIWAAPLVMVALVIGFSVAAASPGLRARLRWRLPAFKEASLARFASTMALLLQKGATLPDALALTERLESGTAAAPALARWRQAIESGEGNSAQWPLNQEPFPGLFAWLIRAGGSEPVAGFRKAAEVYAARAAYRTDLALYGALPISILLLGQMLLWQVVPLFTQLFATVNALGRI